MNDISIDTPPCKPPHYTRVCSVSCESARGVVVGGAELLMPETLEMAAHAQVLVGAPTPAAQWLRPIAIHHPCSHALYSFGRPPDLVSISAGLMRSRALLAAMI